MRRALFIIALLVLPGALWGQSIDGFPCYNSGSGGTNSYAVDGTTGGAGDKITCWCGVPSQGLGNPLRSVANIGAYSADMYTGFASTSMPQRSLDACAAYPNSTLINNAGAGNTSPNLVYFTGGYNTLIGTGDIWNKVGSLPGFTFTVADPNQNGTGGGANVISVAYETDGGGKLLNAVTAGDTTVCVRNANVPTITSADMNTLAGNGTPVNVTIETETVSVTNAVDNPGGCNNGSSRLLTVTPAFASNHAVGYLYRLSSSTGNRFADALLYSAVTVMNWIACGPANDGKGIGNRHDIRIIGTSNGAWIIGMLAGMGAADKATYRAAANNEYNCGNVDDWQITAVSLSSPPLDQSAVTVLASDGSEPVTNAEHFGFGVAGNIGNLTNLWDSGCTGNGASKCSLGACTVNGLTPNGTMSAVDLYAHSKSPQQNAKGNVPGTCTAWNSCPGLLHTPTTLPPMAVDIGAADTNVVPDQAQCFAATYSLPYLVPTDCSGGCQHVACQTQGGVSTSWNVTAQCVAFELKNLFIYDVKYGLTYAPSTPAGVSGSTKGGVL